MKQSDQGILIHRQNYSESSLLITLFTKNNGIQKFISKGVKKKSGNLNPLGIYEITFYKSPKQDLGNITEINQVQVYYNKNTSPLKNIISFFLADLLKQTLKTETEDQESYSYIYNQIQKLHAVDDFNKFLILFMINFLDILGIQPLIENDNANCFDIQKGTFIYENKETSTQIINQILSVFQFSKSCVIIAPVNARSDHHKSTKIISVSQNLYSNQFYFGIA